MSHPFVKLGLAVAMSASLGLLAACSGSSGPSSSDSASTSASAPSAVAPAGASPSVASPSAASLATKSATPTPASTYDSFPASASPSVQSNHSSSELLSLAEVRPIIDTVTNHQWVPVKVFTPNIPDVTGLTGVVVVPQSFLSSAVQFSTNASGDLVSSGSKVDLTTAPKHVAFIFNQSHYVIMGMVTPQGQQLDALALQELGLTKSPAKGLTEAIAPERHSFIWAKAGSKAPIITAFIDPNCIWCHELVKKIEPTVASGAIRVRVVLVGFLKSDSQAKAATILAAKDPAQALLEDEHGFDTKTESGGITPMANPPADLLKAVSANNSFMGSISDKGTPMMLFCNQSKQVQLVEGLPQDLDGLVKSASTQGNPACAK